MEAEEVDGRRCDDLDIYRTARLLIEQHGDKAPIHAAMRAYELLEAGDVDGQEGERSRPRPPPGEEGNLTKVAAARACLGRGMRRARWIEHRGIPG